MATGTVLIPDFDGVVRQGQPIPVAVWTLSDQGGGEFYILNLGGKKLDADGVLENIKPGSTIEQPSFTSTTIRNQKYYGENYEIKMEIFVDRRVKGSYLNDISAFGDEQEPLLERGLKFIVENVQRIERTPGVTGQVVMQVRAVPRGLNWSQVPDAPLKPLT